MDDKNRESLRSIVAEFHTGMLVTKVPEGMRARPMSVAKFEANDDLFFAASVESGKVKEIEDDHEGRRDVSVEDGICLAQWPRAPR